jgi:hypothetical protein
MYVVAIAVVVVHGENANVYDLYDGNLQPFSYSELQATVTNTATPSFIPPETMGHAPEAFPFDMPPLPSDFSNHAPATLQQHAVAPPDHGYKGNPYDSEEFARSVQTNKDWSSHQAIVERALQTAPRTGTTFVEAGSALARSVAPTSASDFPAPENSAGPQSDMAAARTLPIPDSGIQQQEAGDFGDTVSPDASETAMHDSMPNPEQQPPSPSASSFPPPPSSSMPPPPEAPRFTSKSQSSKHSISKSKSGSNKASSSSNKASVSQVEEPSQTDVSESEPESHSEHHEEQEEQHESEHEPTPISGPAKQLHPCVPTGNKKSCRIAFDSNTIPWRVVTVPHLDSSSSSSASSASSGSSSGSSSEDEGSGIQEEYSSNPSIARAQKAYYAKLKELMKEKRWMAEVTRIVEEYNYKIKNVNKHASSTERELRKSRKDIVEMIKSEKQAKLQQELEAALESLQKLEATSNALNGKMQELTQTKLGLKQTISKIQRVITHSSPGALLELQEVMKPTSDEQQYAEKMDANESAKKLFGSLLELVSKSGVSQRLAQQVRHHSRRPVVSFGSDQEEDNQEQSAHTDLNSISDRAAAIAAKYATEENHRMHTNLPLRALSAREYKKASDDDLFLD